MAAPVGDSPLPYSLYPIAPPIPYGFGEDSSESKRYNMLTDKAAKKIQKYARLYLVNRKKDFEEFVATFIQKHVRGFLTRNFLKKQKIITSTQKKHLLYNHLARRIQACVRGMMERNSLRELYAETPTHKKIYSPLQFAAIYPSISSVSSKIKMEQSSLLIQNEWRFYKKRVQQRAILSKDIPAIFLGKVKQFSNDFENHLSFILGDPKIALKIGALAKLFFDESMSAHFSIWEENIMQLVKECTQRADGAFPYKHIPTFGPQKINRNLIFFFSQVESLFLPTVSYQKRNPKHLLFITQGIGRGHMRIAEAAKRILTKKGFTVFIYNYHSDRFDPLKELIGTRSGLWKFSEGVTTKGLSLKEYRKRAFLVERLNYFAPQNFSLQIEKLLAIFTINPSASFVFGSAAFNIGNIVASRLHIPLAVVSTDKEKHIPDNFPSLFTPPFKHHDSLTILTPEGTPPVTREEYDSLRRTHKIRACHIPIEAKKLAIPVRPSFYRISKKEKDCLKKRFGLSIETKVILLTSGGLGHKSSYLKLKEILKTPDELFPFPLHLILVAGENQEVYRKTIDYLKKHPPSSKFTVNPILNASETSMSDFMKIADIMIGKTGGSTTAECEAIGLRVLPSMQGLPWEEANLDHLKKIGLAVKRKPFIPNLINALCNDFTPPPYTDKSDQLFDAVAFMQKKYQRFEEKSLPERMNQLFANFMRLQDEIELRSLINNPLANLESFLQIIERNIKKLDKVIHASILSFHLIWKNILEEELLKRGDVRCRSTPDSNRGDDSDFLEDLEKK